MKSGVADSAGDAACPFGQAAENALTAYRGQNCETLYTAASLADKLNYLKNCSGPGKQVVNTCQGYANALCSSVNACSGNECSSKTDACVLTDLKGIEDFIHSDAKY